MARRTPRPSRAQSLTSLAVLAALVLCAAWVLHTQAIYDPALWGQPAQAQARAEGPRPRLLGSLGPEAYVPLGPVESFGPETLSDKIDGKAELYLPAGFRLLETRRFAHAGDNQAWLEVYVYDMGTNDNAFAVFSAQRRSGGKALEITPNSYQSGGSVFLTHGPYYVEVIGSRPELVAKARSLAKGFVRVTVVAGGDKKGPADLLPTEGRREGSLALLAKDAFGMAGLDQVYVAGYPAGAEELIAFVSRRADAADAARLLAEYAALLTNSGGAPQPAPQGMADARLVEVLGTWELLFVRGPYLAGVRGGESLEATLALGRRLIQALESQAP